MLIWIWNDKRVPKMNRLTIWNLFIMADFCLFVLET